MTDWVFAVEILFLIVAVVGLIVYRERRELEQTASFKSVRAYALNAHQMQNGVDYSPAFSEIQSYMKRASVSEVTTVCLDEAKGKVGFLRVAAANNVALDVIDVGQIVSADLIVDGANSAAGAALAGAVMFGAAGAVVGSSTAGKKKLRDVSVRLLIDDRARPARSVPFLFTPGAPTEPHVRESIERAEDFHARLQLALRRR